MKRILYILLISSNIMMTNAVQTAINNNSNDFVELDKPERKISGAYYGIGYDLSFIKHEVQARNERNIDKSIKKSTTQSAISLLAGFGSSFYEDYYIGLEFEIMKRFSGKTSYEDDIGIKFSQQFGINMDVRFGYLFPKYGNMVYLTLGFSRTLGKVVVKVDGQKDAEKGFGSYFPTIGIGFQQKLNSKWNIHIDSRYSITSKDKYNRLIGNNNWNYNVQPKRIGIRLSLTHNI